MIQYLKDFALEIRIATALNRMLNEPDREKQRDLAARMATLIKKRSPQQVARMERKAGLA